MSNSNLSENETIPESVVLNLLVSLNLNDRSETSDCELNEVQSEVQNEIEMAKPNFDVKYLQLLPEFDGNPNELYHFVQTVTTLLNHYYNQAEPENIQNLFLLHGIISKLRGRAKEVVAIYGCSSWNTIKDTLMQNFGDQRDENTLTRDLVTLRQLPNETPMHFYDDAWEH